MPISTSEAREILQKIVQEWWAETARPILGSQLKVRMLAKVNDFKEQDLGYRNFASFVRDCDGISLQFRGSADFAAVPIQHANALAEQAEERLRIRPDFWQAFVGFAVPNQVRAYDRENDKVLKGPPETIPLGAITIPAIGKEEQLAWRRNFVESLGTDSPLAQVLPDLKVEGGFRIFTAALESHPELRRRWHAVLVTHVAETIRKWARKIGLPDETWLTTQFAAPAALGTHAVVRKRIYELLDTISIDDLLDLRLPIRWLLDVPPAGGESTKD